MAPPCLVRARQRVRLWVPNLPNLPIKNDNNKALTQRQRERERERVKPSRRTHVKQIIHLITFSSFKL